MRIGIDVDLVIFASDVAWWEWLVNMCSDNPDDVIELADLKNMVSASHVLLDYDLSKYFGNPKNPNISAYDFWRSTNAYDTITPVEGAVESIKKLILDGHEITFISHVKGNSSKSKYNALERFFGEGNFSYIATKEKYLVDVDVMIDDRHDVLNSFYHKSRVVPFLLKFYTPYTQKEQRHHGTTCYTWEEIVTRLKEIKSLELLR